MLGTGSGAVMNLYNTCFIIQNETGNFLVDTGGSIELIKRLNKINIDYKSIHHIFLSHCHTDHVFGLIWLFRKISLDIKMGEKIDPIHIYCNDVVYNSIKEALKYFFPDKFIDLIDNIVNYVVLDDGESISQSGIVSYSNSRARSWTGTNGTACYRVTVNATHEHSSVGSGEAHNHGSTGAASNSTTNSKLSSSQSIMPPYLAVYVWKRTA